jgi:hypothetical protein
MQIMSNVLRASRSLPTMGVNVPIVTSVSPKKQVGTLSGVLGNSGDCPWRGERMQASIEQRDEFVDSQSRLLADSAQRAGSLR